MVKGGSKSTLTGKWNEAEVADARWGTTVDVSKGGQRVLGLYITKEEVKERRLRRGSLVES